MNLDRCEKCPNRSYHVKRNYEARMKYRPAHVKILFIAESPPNIGRASKDRYFYFDDNPPAPDEGLYRETMKTLFPDFNPSKPKSIFLKKFQESQFFLLDTARCPVDKKYPQRIRHEAILSCSNRHLLPDLAELKPQALIIIKANVYRLTRDKLHSLGYKILNDVPIPFPNMGHQPDFRKLMQMFLNHFNT